MVEAKCRALMAAALWNGHAAQLTTGSARAPATQPQLGNWKAGNIEMRNTGTARTAATSRRGLVELPPCAMVSGCAPAPARGRSPPAVRPGPRGAAD